MQDTIPLYPPRDIPLNPSKEHISTIGKALSLIFDIQRQIYNIDPKLKPEYLKRPSPYPAELNRQFGNIVIKDAELCDLKKYSEAITLYENFINENPPEFPPKYRRTMVYNMSVQVTARAEAFL